MKIDLFQALIDILRGKKQLPFMVRAEVFAIQRNYKKIKQKLLKKIQNGEKIRVCFSVVYDSVFPAKPIFERMLEDEMFEPFILIIPDMTRGDENMFYQMNKAYKSLSSQYKEVYNSYDYDKKEFKDWSTKADLVFFANPYDSMTNNLYSIKYLAKHALTLHVPYSYTGHIKYSTKVFKSFEYVYLWKVYVENANNLSLIHEYRKYNIDNLEISGFPKMDNITKLDNIQTSKERPLVIIAPHHTVRRIPNYLNLSNFLRLNEFYLELPKKYPNIDFVLRPHPLMFVTLEADDLWGKEKVKEYIDKVNAIPNMVYQEGGDYFETFKKSSAMINDCSSFLPEYFYFDKPQCYVLESEKELYEEFTEIGRNILDNVYKAFTEEDIINFIDNVVLNGNDYMKEKRNGFAEPNVILNHPNVSKIIIENLKKELS